MKTQKLRKTSLMFIMVVFFAIESVSFAAQTSTNETSTKDVKEKVVDASQAIKNYSVNQRDEAVKKAKVALDDLDVRIDSMESQLNKKWHQMDQSARKKSRDTLTALRKQRNEVAEWYGGLKHSSSKAWEDVKKGFLKSYRELRDSFDKAHSEF
jgi:basic membrane lipoprotein Med (substrate-binding protein (PBP1-ABC) superfamily)